MTVKFSLRFLPRISIPALLSVVLAQPVPPLQAQTQGEAPGLWTLPDTGPSEAGPVGGGAEVGGPSVSAARAFLEAELDRYRSAGLIMPRIEDLGEFNDETLLQLQAQLLANPSGICEQSVKAALFLDAHLEEADWQEVARGVERLPALALDTLLIWLPDEHDAFMLLVPQLKALDAVIDTAMDVQETSALMKDYYVPSPAVRSGQWVNEIVSVSMAEQWSEERIEARRAELDEEGQKAAQNMLVRQQEIDDALRMVEQRLQADLAIAWGEREAELRKLADAMGYAPGVSPELVLPPATVAAVDTRYQSKVHALKEAMATEHWEKLKWAFRAKTEAQLATEKAYVQRAALARYAAPIARNACHEITRDDPVATAKPANTVLDLPHDKLLMVLEAIGSRPSADFLGCLCKRAGYGSSGTSQFYHPDTLGDYDRRYACQHPGDPCIVQGYGCMRYPLPSDSEIWSYCSTVTGEPVDKAIDEAIKARRTLPAGSP